MRSLGLVSSVVVSLLGCGKAPADSPLDALLKRTRLKERVRVDVAAPVDPSSLLLTLHGDGSISHEGKGVSLDRVREIVSGPKRDPGGRGEWNTAPILIEAHPEARLRSLRGLLMAMVEGNRVNIAFLAETGRSPGGVTFPVVVGCQCALQAYDGAWCIDEHRQERNRTWMEVESGAGGGVRVLSLHWGPGGEMVEDPAWLDSKPRELGPEEKILKKLESAIPSWRDAAAIGSFFGKPPIAGDDPRIHLKISGDLTVADLLKALSRLRSAAGEHAVLGCAIAGN